MSAWGPGCGLVHDLFDDVYLEGELLGKQLPFLMTTWHSDETIPQALWIALRALPTDEGLSYEEACASTLVAAVQRPWYDEVRGLLLDQDELNRLRLADEERAT